MYLPVLISNNSDIPGYRLALSTNQKGIEVFNSKCSKTDCDVT